jgi:hypothetical protein
MSLFLSSRSIFLYTAVTEFVDRALMMSKCSHSLYVLRSLPLDYAPKPEFFFLAD